jgi:hypothetical protein
MNHRSMWTKSLLGLDMCGRCGLYVDNDPIRIISLCEVKYMRTVQVLSETYLGFQHPKINKSSSNSL